VRAPVHVVCRHEAALGVALAGVAPIEVATAADATRVLGELSRTAGGIALVEAPLYDALSPAFVRQLRRDSAVIVMPFPGPAPLAPAAGPEDELLEVLRRAIGYRVRLR